MQQCQKIQFYLRHFWNQNKMSNFLDAKKVENFTSSDSPKYSLKHLNPRCTFAISWVLGSSLLDASSAPYLTPKRSNLNPGLPGKRNRAILDFFCWKETSLEQVRAYMRRRMTRKTLCKNPIGRCTPKEEISPAFPGREQPGTTTENHIRLEATCFQENRNNFIIPHLSVDQILAQGCSYKVKIT